MAGAVAGVTGDLSKQEGSGSGFGINVFGSSETGKNLDAILNPAANLNRIKSKLDKATGIDELIGIQREFDLETGRLRTMRDTILNRINEAGLQASKAVREARITQTRQRGRSSTILST
jgi:hypothetical protein